MSKFKFTESIFFPLGLAILFVSLIFTGIFTETKMTSQPIMKCESRTVVKLINIFYRGGTVLLSDGTVGKVGQPRDTVEVGSSWSDKCTIVGYTEAEWKL